MNDDTISEKKTEQTQSNMTKSEVDDRKEAVQNEPAKTELSLPMQDLQEIDKLGSKNGFTFTDLEDPPFSSDQAQQAEREKSRNGNRTRAQSCRNLGVGVVSGPMNATASINIQKSEKRRKAKSASGVIQKWQKESRAISKSHKNNNSTMFIESTTVASNDTPLIQPAGHAKKKIHMITPVDLDMIRSLENEYSATAQRTNAQDKAQRIWARRAGLASVLFMITYFTVGVVVLRRLAGDLEEWTVLDTILFCVYTATSAGFGHITIPETVPYYLFNTVYLMTGVAAMAIMVAQVFQWMELEAATANDRRKARELANKGRLTETNSRNPPMTVGIFWRLTDSCLPWFQETAVGRFMSVFLSLAFIALVGAIPIGKIEGWTLLQSIYFGCVAMTTVGYGDLVPETTTGIKLCIAWLPFNVLFSSIYMGSVAKWYLGFSARGVQRITMSLQRKAMTDQHVFERSLTTPPALGPGARRNHGARVHIEVGQSDEDSVEKSETFSLGSDDGVACGADVSGDDTQQELVDHSMGQGTSPSNGTETNQPVVVIENINSTLMTMQDVVDAIHKCVDSSNNLLDAKLDDTTNTITDSMRYLSIQHGVEKPCFALRVLVKERMAQIIANDICGGAHHVDVQDEHIIVRIGQWKDVVKKWSVPTGAWKSFRAAALEAMMLVGERALIRQGPSALLQLSPDEFHSMFSPLVAAMGDDPSTLDGWLQETDEKAKKEFLQQDVVESKKKHRKLTIQDPVVQMPKSQATLFH